MEVPGPPVIGQIQIVMLPDGTVQARAEAPNTVLVLGMLEQAKVMLVEAHARKVAAAPAIEVPGGPLVNRLNGKG